MACEMRAPRGGEERSEKIEKRRRHPGGRPSRQGEEELPITKSKAPDQGGWGPW